VALRLVVLVRLVEGRDWGSFRYPGVFLVKNASKYSGIMVG
jgi:hypothetical protein